MLRDLLRQEGIEIGRQHVATLMKKMAIEAIYLRPNTSKPTPGHKIYPYLLRKLPIVRPNQVWVTDISYIPMARGFVYLVAIVDWFSRKVLAWRVSTTMEADFCVEALEEALARFGKPEIFNTDQCSQGGFNRSSQHHINWRLRWVFEGKGQIDVGDRHYGPLAALPPRDAMNVNRSGCISRED